ncbi:MAG TPA: LacI family transcriptional regulator [Candidatus Hydrogenedentes bacterium]|nr:LacI family transcriptional regulator [Candidatus Hydrogenedentota bacterium]
MSEQPLQGAKHHWTIHDVARLGGVSAKTVSRVVNNEPGVGQATRARIRAIIHEVGYHPHMGARSMRSAPRDCVGVTVSAPMEEVRIRLEIFDWIFAQLYEIFGTRGTYLCFDLNPHEAGEHIDYARGLWEQRYGGCIIVGPLRKGDLVLRRVHESGHPYLVLNRPEDLPECSHACVDYEEAAYISTQFLVKRGHTRIAMLQGFSKFQGGIERLRGYARALDDAGLPFDHGLVAPTSFATREITHAVHRLLLDPAVSALIDGSCAEDAKGIREGARRAGRAPGKDLDVVAWTYTDNAAVLSEACAHVWLPLIEAANAGFAQLADWFYGVRTTPVRIVYRPTLYEAVAASEMPPPRRLFEVLS